MTHESFILHRVSSSCVCWTLQTFWSNPVSAHHPAGSGLTLPLPPARPPFETRLCSRLLVYPNTLTCLCVHALHVSSRREPPIWLRVPTLDRHEPSCLERGVKTTRPPGSRPASGRTLAAALKRRQDAASTGAHGEAATDASALAPTLVWRMRCALEECAGVLALARYPIISC